MATGGKKKDPSELYKENLYLRDLFKEAERVTDMADFQKRIGRTREETDVDLGPTPGPIDAHLEPNSTFTWSKKLKWSVGCCVALTLTLIFMMLAVVLSMFWNIYSKPSNPFGSDALVSALQKKYLNVALPTDDEVRDTAGDVWNIGRHNFCDELDYHNALDGPLFTHTPEVDARLGAGTYGLLTALYQDYEPRTGIAEVCEAACQARRNAFLEAMVDSHPMKAAFREMSNYDGSLAHRRGRRQYLRDIWFTPYSRSGRHQNILDSSGFEHVFLGEIRNNQAIGYHGWPKAYLDEQKDDMIYQYTDAICQPHISSFVMEYLGNEKRTSMFMRTPPEVEMALYTLCFFSRPGQECYVRLQGFNVTIQTYTYDCGRGRVRVGAAYPVCP